METIFIILFLLVVLYTAFATDINYWLYELRLKWDLWRAKRKLKR